MRLDRDDRVEHEKLDRLRAETEKDQEKYAKKAGNKNPYGCWVEYREKKSGDPFFYNTVSRKVTKDKPKDFKPDKGRLVEEKVYGLHFYH
jgi:hypothetical protein